MSSSGSLSQYERRSPVRSVELSRPRSIHVVGIGGAGMRAIARVLLAMGHRVSGSDRAASRFVDELRELGASVFVGHDASNVAGAELLTRSTAIADDNPEIAAAVEADLDVFSRAEILASITAVRPAILVAGTHGKTTTSSMLAVVCDVAGRSPSFVVGSDIAHFGSGARWTDTDTFVVEADESDGTFLALTGHHAIVTSLDPDHLDYYDTVENLQHAFEAFVDAIPGITAVCIDDADTTSLIGRGGVVTYGTHSEADVRISDVEVGRTTTQFVVTAHRQEFGEVSVGLAGHHNALNAAGGIAIALELGIPFAAIAEGLAAFDGVARRMEVRGESAGVRFVDDYAHLPAEVEVAVATGLAGGWNRVIAVYQPHRYSRTESLGATFATAFHGVDHLVLTDIYPSGETPRPGVTGRIVYDAVVEACPDMAVSWQPGLTDVADHLVATLGPGDLCLTLGAGDLTTVPDRVIDRLDSQATVTIDWLLDEALGLSASQVWINEPIGPRTTYRVGGAARALVEVASRGDLERIVAGAIATQTPLLALGKGSNLLVADSGFQGVALLLGGEFETMQVDGTSVTLGAAVALPVAARQTVAASLRGFEWAVGVPGSIGGAIVMNAGGHGSDMAATTRSATVLDLQTGRVATRDLPALRFGYRSSSIAATEVVLDATMDLVIGDRLEAEALVREIVKWRRENQPGGQNAGSVFTNPEGDSAGRLIDHAGCKGTRIGSAAVSEKHANFIQVDPGGRAADVFALMTQVATTVHERTGVALEPETRLIGFAPWPTVTEYGGDA